jgi:copper(I)-binding protein
MSLTIILRGALAAVILSFPSFALADGIGVSDAFIRSSGPAAVSGAAFMVLENSTDQDDRLIAVSSDVAKKIELHTHQQQGDGIMKMIMIEGGIAIPAGQTHALERGGDHVMLMGLTRPLVQGESVVLTLTFEKADPLTVEVPVDLLR